MNEHGTLYWSIDSADGRKATRGMRTSVDPDADLRTMFAALELTSALRRGVAIKPERFMQLVSGIEPAPAPLQPAYDGREVEAAAALGRMSSTLKALAITIRESGVSQVARVALTELTFALAESAIEAGRLEERASAGA